MPKSRGFSLLEMVCVIAIIAVVSAIVLPHWAAAVQNQQMNLALRRIGSDIALAQARANYGSTAVTIAFNPDSNSYQIVGMPDPDRPNQTYTVSLAADPYRVTLTSATFQSTGTSGSGPTTMPSGTGSPSASMAFDGYGTPLAGGTIVLSQGSTSRTLSVDASSGKVSY